jgi:glycerate kinase
MGVERAGAAGGLAGALYALGADLVSGFEEVARANRLSERIARAGLVITGEGRVDLGSLEGKVVAGVCALTSERQQVLVVCGAADPEAVSRLQQRHPWVHVEDLVSQFGERRSFDDTLSCVAEVVTRYVSR